MSKSLSFGLVFVAGALNREQSLKAAESALDLHIAQRHTEQETIKDAVNAVFDKYRGTNITMPTIEGMISRELNCTPANYAVLTKLALDYVRENASPKREDGKLFAIQKGKGKGVIRWSDVPVTDAPAAAPAAASEPTVSDESDESDDSDDSETAE